MARGRDQDSNGWLEVLHVGCISAALLGPVSASELVRDPKVSADGEEGEAEAAEDEDAGAANRLEESIGMLWETLHADQDDWHATRFLRHLLSLELPGVDRVFRDALDSHSPNVQAKAITRFAWQSDPEVLSRLEALWKDETRPWVLADLMEAFIELESVRHAESFRILAHGEEMETALAAIRALSALEVDDADQDLAQLTLRASSEVASIAAVRALADWPASDIALEAVLEASWSPRPRMRDVAFETLGAWASPTAIDRLIEAAHAEASEEVLETIRDALVSSPDERVTPMLVDMLHRAVGDSADGLVASLLESLYRRDDPTALDGILDLVTGTEEPSSATINGLAAYLGRDRSAGGKCGTVTTVSISCGFGAPIDPSDPDTRLVRPSTSARSIRCWEAPGEFGRVVLRPRLPEEMLVRITDHFERSADLWVEVSAFGWLSCWVLERNLERLEPDDALMEEDAGSAPVSASAISSSPDRPEFDGDVDELAMPGAVVLQEAGILEIIEPGKDVVGLALRIEDVESRVLAQSICEAGGCGEAVLSALGHDTHRSGSGR